MLRPPCDVVLIKSVLEILLSQKYSIPVGRLFEAGRLLVRKIARRRSPGRESVQERSGRGRSARQLPLQPLAPLVRAHRALRRRWRARHRTRSELFGSKKCVKSGQACLCETTGGDARVEERGSGGREGGQARVRAGEGPAAKKSPDLVAGKHKLVRATVRRCAD